MSSKIINDDFIQTLHDWLKRLIHFNFTVIWRFSFSPFFLPSPRFFFAEKLIAQSIWLLWKIYSVYSFVYCSVPNSFYSGSTLRVEGLRWWIIHLDAFSTTSRSTYLTFFISSIRRKQVPDFMILSGVSFFSNTASLSIENVVNIKDFERW